MKFYLKVSAEMLNNITYLRPIAGWCPSLHTFIIKLKCETCNTVNENIPLTIGGLMELAGSEDTLVHQCHKCGTVGTLSTMDHEMKLVPLGERYAKVFVMKVVANHVRPTGDVELNYEWAANAVDEEEIEVPYFRMDAGNVFCKTLSFGRDNCWYWSDDFDQEDGDKPEDARVVVTIKLKTTWGACRN